MRKAMREPLFVEFVDECLRVVDPQPSDITDEQVSQFYFFASYKTEVSSIVIGWYRISYGTYSSVY